MLAQHIHAIIFDFDGTLVDSMNLWHQIDVDFLRRRGLLCPNDLSMAISGKSFTETAEYFKERFLLPDSIAEIKAEWDEMSRNAILNEIGFKPGALPFLSWVDAHAIPMAIATSNTRSTLELFLPQYGIDQYFHSLHFTCEVGRGKPHPDVFLAAAKALDVLPEHCLVFEDTLEGIHGARSAGMTVISVDDALQSHRLDRIKESSLHHIQSFRELMTPEFSKHFHRRLSHADSF
ncbi:HAD family hydrolase [Acetobacterium sp.]|uniref:HAD family hydrolase n=1 Tax=Acetobacterium sp. TaxID=1872094 RepID=UPI0035935D59